MSCFKSVYGKLNQEVNNYLYDYPRTQAVLGLPFRVAGMGLYSIEAAVGTAGVALSILSLGRLNLTESCKELTEKAQFILPIGFDAAIHVISPYSSIRWHVLKEAGAVTNFCMKNVNLSFNNDVLATSKKKGAALALLLTATRISDLVLGLVGAPLALGIHLLNTATNEKYRKLDNIDRPLSEQVLLQLSSLALVEDYRRIAFDLIG